MHLNERKTCPLCQSKSIKLFKTGTINPTQIKTDDFKITDSHYGSLWTFFCCNQCKFVFSNPYLPEKHIIEFYSQLEDNEYSSEAEGRSKNFKTLFKRLKKLNPGPSLLDIGAASGIFLDLANHEGYQTAGVEPSTPLANEAKEKYGIQLFNGTIENYHPNQKFSVITMLDIIEHLVEPDTFMTAVDSLLEDDGYLIIVTPDIHSLAARIMGRRWWHYRIAHINFFNLPALQYLLKKHHYNIVLKKKYVWNFTLFYLITRLFPSLKNQNKGETTLQKLLKKVHLKLPLFDSWEIYARKTRTTTNNQ
ncbi:MAG: class I SAM-dependent methyltransferase [bacterium]|nr:class I SAM-dependent methyltransferase [bacterium]